MLNTTNLIVFFQEYEESRMSRIYLEYIDGFVTFVLSRTWFLILTNSLQELQVNIDKKKPKFDDFNICYQGHHSE